MSESRPLLDRKKISHLIDRLHLDEFSLRLIFFLTKHADLPFFGKIIRFLGDIYTRYLIHGEILVHNHVSFGPHNHSGQLPHRVVDHENALKMIEKEKDLSVIDCMCRMIIKKCNSPLKTCILVGPEARRRNQIHPEQRLTTDQASHILKSSFENNLIHNAIFVLGNLVEICNCCKCCCLPILGVKKGFESLLPSAFMALKSNGSCDRCGTCEDICPFDAIINGIIHQDRCFGCGLCAYKCPGQCIEMVERDQIRAKGGPERPLLRKQRLFAGIFSGNP